MQLARCGGQRLSSTAAVAGTVAGLVNGAGLITSLLIGGGIFFLLITTLAQTIFSSFSLLAVEVGVEVVVLVEVDIVAGRRGFGGGEHQGHGNNLKRRKSSLNQS